MESLKTVDEIPPTVKLLFVWFWTVFGMVTLHDVVLVLTAIYTALQIYVFMRDKVLKKVKTTQTMENSDG